MLVWKYIIIIVYVRSDTVFEYLIIFHQAAEKKQLELIIKEQEEADNTAEMYNNLTSDMLTENPDVAKSALGKNRWVFIFRKYLETDN